MKIGERNHIFQFSTLGDEVPTKYKNEPTTLVIGNENIIREGYIHRGTVQDRGETLIGDRN